MTRVKPFEVVMFLVAVLLAMFLGLRAASAQTKECVDDPVPKCKAGERVSFYPSKCGTVTNEKGCEIPVYRTVRRCVPDSKVFLAENSRLSDENTSLKARISKLEAKLAKLDAKNAKQKERIKALKEELAACKKDAERLNSENGELKKKIAELEVKVSDLQAEIARLTEENADLREENDNLRGPYRFVIGVEFQTDVRVVDPQCTTCRNKFPMGINLLAMYRFSLGEVFKIAPGLFGRLGGDTQGEFYGGGGGVLEFALYPEHSRTFKMAADIRGLVEGNASVTEWNFEVRFGIGAEWAPGFGLLFGVGYARLAPTDQTNVPFVYLQGLLGIPGTN